jgi:hypothetical protein
MALSISGSPFGVSVGSASLFLKPRAMRRRLLVLISGPVCFQADGQAMLRMMWSRMQPLVKYSGRYFYVSLYSGSFN